MENSTTITKLKARYLPTRNTTLANYQFHRLRQDDMEAYDIFVNRVKQEASNCSFKCNENCTVQDTLIRDQIIIGTTDNEIRKKALGEQWQLTDLITKGRQMEAASVGSQQIKTEVKQEQASVARVKPGKYSRKNRKKKQCINCSNKACKGGENCVAHIESIECFDCHTIGHFKGAAACEGKKAAKSKDKSRRVAKKKESDSDAFTDQSEDDDSHIHRVASAKGIHAAHIVGHVRRSQARCRRSGSNHPQKKRLRYEVPILIKEKVVDMYADTGADVSVMSHKLSKELELPLVKTKMRIKPYGTKKRIRCVGYYVGPIMYGNTVANVGIYVVNDKWPRNPLKIQWF